MKTTRPTSTPNKRPAKKPKFNRQDASSNVLRKSEKKNIDVNQASPIVAGQTTATVALLNQINNGAGPTQRVGRECRQKSLFYRFVGNMAPTSAGASPIRLLIVYDKQTNGALPATTQVVVADSIENPMQLFNKKRFIILVDEEIPCLGTGGPQAFSIKGYRRLNMLAYEGNNVGGGTIADIQAGAIYSFVWQTGGIITASPPSQLYTRIRFDDD